MNRSNLLDQTKQGLQKVNAEQINAKINDLTCGSAKYEMMQRKNQKQLENSAKLREKCQMLSKASIVKKQEELDRDIDERYCKLLEQFPRFICVVDFDCFFCAVESIDLPELVKKPMIVAGGSIVCASNYEARKYGIRSAMPVAICRELCSNLVVIQSNQGKYSKVSKAAGKIFRQFDCNYCMLSIDEAELNITQRVLEKYKQLHQLNPQEINQLFNQVEKSTNFLLQSNYEIAAALVVQELRTSVYNELKITVSAGVSYSTQLAKLCCDLKKPNGQTITNLMFKNINQLKKFTFQHLHILNIRKIWGIGSVTENMLNTAFDIKTIGQIYEKRGMLMQLLTPSCIYLVLSACGLQNLFETVNENAKSIGHQMTFSDSGDQQQILQHLKQICKSVCLRLQKKEEIPKRIKVQLRFADWSEISHIHTLDVQSNNLDVIYTNSVKILLNMWKNKQISSGGQIVQTGFGNTKRDYGSSFLRLIGVSCLLSDEDQEQLVQQKSGIDKFVKTRDISILKQDTLQKQEQLSNIISNEQSSSQEFEVLEIKSNKCSICGLVFNNFQLLALHLDNCKQKQFIKSQQKRGQLDKFFAKQRAIK